MQLGPDAVVPPKEKKGADSRIASFLFSGWKSQFFPSRRRREGGRPYLFSSGPNCLLPPLAMEKEGQGKLFSLLLSQALAAEIARATALSCSSAGEKAVFRARKKKREIESPSFFRPRLSYHPKRGERREGGCCNKSGAGKREGHAVSPLFYRDPSAVPSLNVRPSISFVEFFRHRVRGLA